jgi:hypothetical protein
MSRQVNRAVLGLLACWLQAGPAPAAASHASARNWHDEKCLRYQKAWSRALERIGPAGLSRGFLDSHAGFLASGCTRSADVCPHSPEEFRLANILVVLAMNAGTASTFPPFACPSRKP